MKKIHRDEMEKVSGGYLVQEDLELYKKCRAAKDFFDSNRSIFMNMSLDEKGFDLFKFGEEWDNNLDAFANNTIAKNVKVVFDDDLRWNMGEFINFVDSAKR